MPVIFPSPIDNINTTLHTFTQADWEADWPGTLGDIANDIVALLGFATLSMAKTRVTAAGSVHISSSGFWFIRKSTPAATAVTIDQAIPGPVGVFAAGNAAAYPVTLSVAGGGTINGQTTLALSVAYRGVRLDWDGTEYVITAQLYSGGTPPAIYDIDLANPPSNITLQPGDKARFVGFSLTNNFITLPISTVSTSTLGLYRITLRGWTDAADTNVYFRPNNTTYPGAFFNSSIYGTDTNVTGVDSGGPSLTSITSPPWVGKIPLISIQGADPISFDQFFMDMFGGPNDFDSLYDRGPFILDMIVSTIIGTKSIMSTGGILGGPSIHTGVWNDTTTPWTSLGTFIVYVAGAPPVSNFSMTGIVERLV